MALIPTSNEDNLIYMDITLPRLQIDVIVFTWDIISAALKWTKIETSSFATPLGMKSKDVDALDSTINAICELKNIGIGVITDHASYLPKNLLKTIST